MRIGITTSATFKSKTYVAGATKANMSGAITGDTPEAFVEALHDVNDCADSDEWEDCAKFINKCADKLAGNAYESSVYNNYIFSLEDCEVDVEFADTPSEPDYDGDDYVSVRYVPLNI